MHEIPLSSPHEDMPHLVKVLNEWVTFNYCLYYILKSFNTGAEVVQVVEALVR